MKRIIYIALLLIGIQAVNAKTAPARGNFQARVFSDLNIVFNPSKFPDGLNNSDSIICLANGRIAIKKIKIPDYKRNVRVTAKLCLTSNGDP